MAETRETAPAMWVPGPEQQGAQLGEGRGTAAKSDPFRRRRATPAKREFNVSRVPREGNRPRLHPSKSRSVRMKTLVVIPTALTPSRERERGLRREAERR